MSNIENSTGAATKNTEKLLTNLFSASNILNNPYNAQHPAFASITPIIKNLEDATLALRTSPTGADEVSTNMGIETPITDPIDIKFIRDILRNNFNYESFVNLNGLHFYLKKHESYQLETSIFIADKGEYAEFKELKVLLRSDIEGDLFLNVEEAYKPIIQHGEEMEKIILRPHKNNQEIYLSVYDLHIAMWILYQMLIDS